MRKQHDLKVWPEQFRALDEGDKNFEVRYNDRDFKVGDFLNLLEWCPILGEICEDAGYTGGMLGRRVTHILEGGSFGVEPGYVIMSLK